MKSFFDGTSCLWLQVIVALCGGVLSIIGHEMFHVLMHLGQIKSVALFPSDGAIMELMINTPQNYDAFGEEVTAYFITAVILIITTIIVAKLYDKRDDRSVRITMFKKEASMQELSPVDIANLAYRAGILN